MIAAVCYFCIVFVSFLAVGYLYPVQFLRLQQISKPWRHWDGYERRYVDDVTKDWIKVENPITHIQELKKEEVVSLWYVTGFFVLYPLFMSWLLYKMMLYVLNVSFNKSLQRQHNIQKSIEEKQLVLKKLNQEIETARLELQ